MIKAADHEERGDLRIKKRWRFFALAFAAIAAVEIFILSTPASNCQFFAFALMTVVLHGLSADRLFKCCASLPVDERAWEEFFHRYQQDIRTAICRVIGFSSDTRYSHLFADIMQRFNLRLLENGRRALLSFRGTTDREAKAFLRKVAARVALNILNQEKNSHPQLLVEPLSGVPGDGDFPDPITTGNEEYLILLDTIKQCLREVTHGKNKYRNILICKLAIIDGLSAKEIIEIRGLGFSNVHAVEQQITRIRSKLQAYLKKQ
jgi:DNA-directed RNA polymerase specialized sigma24 family protein